MENDLSKYLLYMTAITAAVGALQPSTTALAPLKCLVVGPGRSLLRQASASALTLACLLAHVLLVAV
jgi:hypothetical protein